MKWPLNKITLLPIGFVSAFSSNNSMFLSSENYLGSLSKAQISTQEESGEISADYRLDASSVESFCGGMTDTASLSETADAADLMETVDNTPDEHYAKTNPGAGWAGYKHPQFGGYLDNLNQNNFEEGQKANYGDDIRWGAQVYLDRLSEDSVGEYNHPQFEGYLSNLRENQTEEEKRTDYVDDIRWDAHVYLDRSSSTDQASDKVIHLSRLGNDVL